MRQKLWPDIGRDDAAELNSMHVPHAVFVAEQEDQLVGFAEATVRSVVEDVYFESAAYLEGIWVAEEFRSRKVASGLLDAVEAWARAQGLRAIGSDAAIDNTGSIAWHSAAGFEEVDRAVLFVKRLGD